MCKKRLIALALIISILFSGSIVSAIEIDMSMDADDTVELINTEYEYVPIHHEEIVTNLRDDQDIEPIKPFYIPTAEELAQHSEQEGGVQVASEGIATVSTTVSDIWSDIFYQAYGESYFAPYLNYEDGARVTGNTNKLVIENTDLELKGKNGLDITLKRTYDNQYTNDSFYTTRIDSELPQYRYLYRVTTSNSETIYIAFRTTDVYYEYLHNKSFYVSSLPTKRDTFTSVEGSVQYTGYLFENVYRLKTTTVPRIRLINTEDAPIYARYQKESVLEPCAMNLYSPTHELGQGWIFTLPDAYLAMTNDYIDDGTRTTEYTGTFRTLSGEVYSMEGHTDLEQNREPKIFESRISSDDDRYYPEMFYETQTKDGIEYDFTIYDAYYGYTYYFYTPYRTARVNMKIVAIYDEFGNNIKYEYVDDTEFAKLSKIIDTYGREITFTYEDAEESSTNEQTLTVSYTEGGQAKNIVYKTEILPASALVNDSTLKEKPVHKFSVTNQEGETTEYYSREAETIAASLWGTSEYDVSTDIFNYGDAYYASKSYNIEQIVYPTGMISKYRYDRKSYRMKDIFIFREYYALIYSCDVISGSIMSNVNNYTLSGKTGQPDTTVTILGTTVKGLKQERVYDYYGMLYTDKKEKDDTIYVSDTYSYRGTRGDITSNVHIEPGINVTTNYTYYSDHYPSSVTDGKSYTAYAYHTKDGKFTGIPSQTDVYSGDGTNHTLDFSTRTTLDSVYTKIASEEIVKDDVVLSKTDYTYNSDGEIASVTASVDGTDSVVENYSYSTDSNKNIIVTVSVPNVTDADGNSVGAVSQTYKLDIHGNPISYTDANSNTTTIRYDGVGRITRRFYPNGGYETYTYDIPNNTITTTAVSGQKIRYNYDKAGRLISTEYLDGSVWKTLSQYTYDGYGRVTKKIIYTSSDDGTKENYTYDAFDRPLTQAVYNLADNALQYTTTYQYTPGYTVLNVTASDGTVVLGEKSYFDNYGRVYKQSRTENNADALFFTYTYDYLDRVVSEKDAKGNITTYAYDALGNLLNTTYANGTTVSNTYDRLGRVLSTTDANGNTTNMTYDKLGRLVKTIFPIDASRDSMVKYYYDGNGNLTKQATQSNLLGTTIPTFDIVEYEYDATNNMVKSTQYANGETDPQITQYYYDESGNVLRMYTGLTSPIIIDDIDDVTNGDDAEYSTFKYQYDKLGRLLKFTDALNKAETYTYDYAGNVLTKTDRDGYTVTTTYNGLGLPTSMTSSKDNVVVSYTYDSLGNRKTMTDSTGTTSYTYDSLSRLATETTSTGYTKTYTYDNNNNVVSFTLSDASGAVISSSYAYDTINRITSATNNAITETYAYDNNSNLTGRTNTAVNVTNNYNSANWQTRARTVASSTADIMGYYNYDGTLARTNALYRNSTYDDLLTNYTYDGLNRLASEDVYAEEGSSILSYTNTYTFDDNSNRATLDSGSYEYDANNRMTLSPESSLYSYSDSGLLNSDGTYAYVYDGFNRLVQVKDYATNAVIASYTYNGDGQRITKTVGGVTTTYVWNGDYIIYETTGTTEQKYYYGTSLYAMEDTNGNVYYYGKNIHGDIVELYDEDGEYVRDYRYDTFGNQLLTNSGDTNPFRYAGEYYDAETGLIYLRNRYYNPTTGRFITEDPIRDGLNWYVYCGNNPVMFVDPLGLEYLVVSGSEYDLNRYKYNFIEPAIKTLKELQSVDGGEPITWLISSTGYSDEDINNFIEVGKDLGINVVFFSNTTEFIDYINTKDRYASTNPNVSYSTTARDNDQIERFYVYSHGVKGAVAFGYNQDNRAELEFTTNHISQIRSDAFSSPLSWFYSCNTATGGNSSFLKTWFDKVGGYAGGYSGRTAYDFIMYSPEYFSYSFWSKEKKQEKEKIAELRAKYGFSANGSLNLPIPSAGVDKVVYQ